MYTKITYIGTLNGIFEIWCGFKPEGAIITEERVVLYPEIGYELERISDGERFSAVWLKEEDSQENYKEVKAEEPPL